MLVLLELEVGVTAAVLVVQIFHLPFKRKKKAQVNEFDREFFPLVTHFPTPSIQSLPSQPLQQGFLDSDKEAILRNSYRAE